MTHSNFTCKTCKWAKSESPSYIQCHLLGSEYGEPDHHAAGAYALDYDEYSALFRVTDPETFGCLCHSDLRPELLI